MSDDSSYAKESGEKHPEDGLPETIRRYFESVRLGHISDDLLAPDVKFCCPFGGSYEGAEAVAPILVDAGKVLTLLNVLDWAERTDTVFVRMEVRWEPDHRVLHMVDWFTLRDDKILEVQAHFGGKDLVPYVFSLYPSLPTQNISVD
jgi:hypothetical protein